MSRRAWLWIGLGLVGIAAGVWLMTTASLIAGGIVAIVGILVGVLPPLLETLRPSEQLADEHAREELARREEQRRMAAEERERQRQIEERRLALLRDLDRMRRAIVAELGKLRPPEPLVFTWGGRSNTAEERAYWLEDGGLHVRFQHQGQGGQWDWPEGGLPSPKSGRTYDVNEVADVELVYSLFKSERYLVAENLPEERLEGVDPGYFRFGV
jgi:hypothetical protein